MSAPELAVGHVVEGKYEIQALLNHGGAVATYRANMAANVSVALKFYDPRLESFPEVAERLARCETLTNELPGDLVVRIVDGGKDPATGALYTVTHFDADSSLEDLVAWSPLSPPEMVAFVQSLARALDSAHARGLAHLSLKPTNLFVGSGPAYHVRLVDFAMSLVHGALELPAERRASVSWLAPEQTVSATGGVPASDIFASALLAFYALTGKSYWRSFESDSFDEAAWQSEMLGSGVPVSRRAREMSASLDPAFDSAFARALAVSPDERFRTASEFGDALASALAASADTAARAAIGFATTARPLAASLDAPELEGAGPTSTSAMVLAPSSPPYADVSSSTAVKPASNVPPPPLQVAALLAAFETAAPHRFPMGSSTTPSVGTELPAVPMATGSARAAARRWSPPFWVAGIAAGALIAAGIVRAIAFNKGPTEPTVAQVADTPAASATPGSQIPAAPAGPISQGNDAPPAVAAEPPARTAKPSTKTVRPPVHAQPRGGGSSAPRKPCGKSSKPCK